VELIRKSVEYIRKTRDRHKLGFAEVFGRKRRRGEPREERTCRVLQSPI